MSRTLAAPFDGRVELATVATAATLPADPQGRGLLFTGSGRDRVTVLRSMGGGPDDWPLFFDIPRGRARSGEPMTWPFFIPPPARIVKFAFGQ